VALVLDATVGGANSNAYLDRVAAQTLIDAMPNSTAWGVDPAAQDLALVRATTLLEVLAYQGVKVSAQQALAWPRFGVTDPDYGDVTAQSELFDCSVEYLDQTIIPRRMKRACATLALEILKAGTSDLWGADDTTNMKQLSIGPITIDYADVVDRRRGLRAFPQVWREVFALTVGSEPARVVRG
jgi:hypothetical protein